MLTRHTRAFLLKVQNNFILQNLLQMVITTWSSHLQLGRLLAKLFFDGWVLSIFDDQTTHSVAANKGEGNSRCLLWVLWKQSWNVVGTLTAVMPPCPVCARHLYLCLPPAIHGITPPAAASSAVCTHRSYSKHCRMTCPGPVSTLHSM